MFVPQTLNSFLLQSLFSSFLGGGGWGDNATEDMLMATKNRNRGHVGFPIFFSFGFVTWLFITRENQEKKVVRFGTSNDTMQAEATFLSRFQGPLLHPENKANDIRK